MTPSNRLYKIEEKQNFKFEDDNDSIYSAEDTKDALILSVNNPIELWILDSVASFHLSSSKKLFQNFKKGNFGKVYLADNKTLEIEEKRDVWIQTLARNESTL